jgi:hypothetical protein
MAGFDLQSVWAMTPRQIAAYLHFTDMHQAIAEATALNVAALGARGDEKDLKKFMEGLQPQCNSGPRIKRVRLPTP